MDITRQLEDLIKIRKEIIDKNYQKVTNNLSIEKIDTDPEVFKKMIQEYIGYSKKISQTSINLFGKDNPVELLNDELYIIMKSLLEGDKETIQDFSEEKGLISDTYANFINDNINKNNVIYAIKSDESTPLKRRYEQLLFFIKNSKYFEFSFRYMFKHIVNEFQDKLCLVTNLSKEQYEKYLKIIFDQSFDLRSTDEIEEKLLDIQHAQKEDVFQYIQVLNIFYPNIHIEKSVFQSQNPYLKNAKISYNYVLISKVYFYQFREIPEMLPIKGFKNSSKMYDLGKFNTIISQEKISFTNMELFNDEFSLELTTKITKDDLTSFDNVNKFDFFWLNKNKEIIYDTYYSEKTNEYLSFDSIEKTKQMILQSRNEKETAKLKKIRNIILVTLSIFILITIQEFVRRDEFISRAEDYLVQEYKINQLVFDKEGKIELPNKVRVGLRNIDIQWTSNNPQVFNEENLTISLSRTKDDAFELYAKISYFNSDKIKIFKYTLDVVTVLNAAEEYLLNESEFSSFKFDNSQVYYLPESINIGNENIKIEWVSDNTDMYNRNDNSIKNFNHVVTYFRLEARLIFNGVRRSLNFDYEVPANIYSDNRILTANECDNVSCANVREARYLSYSKELYLTIDIYNFQSEYYISGIENLIIRIYDNLGNFLVAKTFYVNNSGIYGEEDMEYLFILDNDPDTIYIYWDINETIYDLKSLKFEISYTFWSRYNIFD